MIISRPLFLARSVLSTRLVVPIITSSQLTIHFPLTQNSFSSDTKKPKKPPTSSKSSSQSTSPPTSAAASSTANSPTPTGTTPPHTTPTGGKTPTDKLDLDLSPFKLDQKYAPTKRFEGHTGKLAANLFIYAGIAGDREKIHEELLALKQKLETDPQFAKNIENIPMKYSEYENQWKSAFKKINPSRYLIAVFDYLAEHRKLNVRFLKLLIERYDIMMRELSGIFEGEYISAKPVPERALPLLIENFSQKFLKPGQTLKLKTKVDPAIIGGYILKIGIQTYNFSHASAIQKAIAMKEKASLYHHSSLEDALKIVHPLIG